MSTQHLIILGKVQGVFYRASAKETAEEMGLTGWVRNTKEGNVEIMVTGHPEKLQAFADWCKKGPSRAKVEKVILEPAEDMDFAGFDIVR